MLLGRGLFQVSDKDIHFHAGLPSTAVFDKLLKYLSPDGKCSHVVY